MKENDDIVIKTAEELLAEEKEREFSDIPPDTGRLSPMTKLLIQWGIFVLFLAAFFIMNKLRLINLYYWIYVICLLFISLVLVVSVLALKRAKDSEDDILRTKKSN